MLEQVMPMNWHEYETENQLSFTELTRRYWVFQKEEDMILHNVVLVSRFISDIPAPIVYYLGDRGSAKTTSMKLDRMVVDPSNSDIKAMPHSINDIVAALSEEYMIAFDNLEGNISPEMSNLFCICCTSGVFSKKKLFTDNEKTCIQLKTRLSLSGITTVTQRADFLDRCITLTSKRIPPKNRKTLEEVLDSFKRDLPYMLWQIFDILSKAIPIYKTVEIEELPRMADFARWGYAIADAIGYGGNQFLAIYKKNQEDALSLMVEEDTILPVLIEFMEQCKYFRGSMTELLSALTKQAQLMEIDTRYGLCKNVNSLSRKLFQSQSVLAQFGIYLNRGKNNGVRYVEIEKGDTDGQIHG